MADIKSNNPHRWGRVNKENSLSVCYLTTLTTSKLMTSGLRDQQLRGGANHEVADLCGFDTIEIRRFHFLHVTRRFFHLSKCFKRLKIATSFCFFVESFFLFQAVFLLAFSGVLFYNFSGICSISVSLRLGFLHFVRKSGLCISEVVVFAACCSFGVWIFHLLTQGWRLWIMKIKIKKETGVFSGEENKSNQKPC